MWLLVINNKNRCVAFFYICVFGCVFVLCACVFGCVLGCVSEKERERDSLRERQLKKEKILYNDRKICAIYREVTFGTI